MRDVAVKRYSLVIEKAGNNLSAYSPELPGCVATGETVEETEENMRKAIKMHLRERISRKRSDIAVRSQEARKNIRNKQYKSGTSADLLEGLNQ
jgi:predicted RNase H-like HicB family nuclease